MSNSLQAPDLFWTDPTVSPSVEKWTSWKSTFIDYVEMLPVFNCEIKLTEDHKLKLLRMRLGDEGRRLFDALNLQSKLTFSDALADLDKHWGLRMNTYTSRFKFSSLRQAAGEELNGFISRLLCSVRQCEYGAVPQKKIEEVLLIQQLISGVRDSRIRETLLAENSVKLTWERACDLARAKVQVDDQNKLFSTISPSAAISRVKETAGPCFNYSKHTACYRCGSPKHKANYDKCPAINATCRLCNKPGHFARACRSKSVAAVTETLEDVGLKECSGSEHIFSVHEKKPQSSSKACEPPLPIADTRTVFFEVGGRTISLCMEMDSASPITIVPLDFYKKHLVTLPISPSSYTFGSYSSNPVPIKGFVTLSAFLNNTSKSEVAVYISSTNTKPLLGRNAMVALRIGPSIHKMIIANIDVSDLKLMYPKLFLDGVGRIPAGMHQIRLKSNAVPLAIAQPRPVPLAKRELISDALNKMLQHDLIEKIQCSEWVHPLVAVLKKDGTVRVCTDLRALNRHIIVEKFPLPTADELIVKMSGAKFFSKLDISQAYYHMPLLPESRPLTAFLTQDGLYQYKVLPMGLSSAPAAWQKFMTLSFSDLTGCVVYMDDICVFGKSASEHDANLHAVLSRLNKLNLRLNLTKCQIAVQEIEFLSHTISNAGVKPCTKNTFAILNCPKPRTSDEVRRFLGLCNYYLQHFRNFATISEPLRGTLRKNTDFVWGKEQEAAYRTIRNLVASAPIMAIFDESSPTFVSTDASNVGLGAVLSQLQNGIERVVAYASRALSPTEMNYSAGEKEALACVWACEKWHLYLFGRRFILRTDHASLTSLLCRGNKGQKPIRISRWYARLLNYDFQMQHVSGAQNQVADALSRLPVANQGETEDIDDDRMISCLNDRCTATISLKRIQDHTVDDSLLTEVQQHVINSWPDRKLLKTELIPYHTIRDELTVVNKCLLRGARFIIPESLIADVLRSGHEGHPGIVRTKARIREYYWWPRMNSSVETAVRDCAACQHSDKSSKPIDAPIQPIEYPMQPWVKLAIDVMGPFENVPQNKKNVLVASCFYTKWPEAHLCGETTTTVIINWLRHLFARFGLPEEIVTDNGPQFRSYEFSQFLSHHDIRHVRTAPYNPSANGMVERLNRTLKESIQSTRLEGESWDSALLTSLAAYRTTPHTATGVTPAKLMFGREIRTKLNAAYIQRSVMNQEELERRRKYQESYKKAGNQCTVGTYVRVKKTHNKKGESSFSAPVAVREVRTPGTYILDNNSMVNARRLCTALKNTKPREEPTIAESVISGQIPKTRSLPRRSRRTKYQTLKYGMSDAEGGGGVVSNRMQVSHAVGQSDCSDLQAIDNTCGHRLPGPCGLRVFRNVT